MAAAAVLPVPWTESASDSSGTRPGCTRSAFTGGTGRSCSWNPGPSSPRKRPAFPSHSVQVQTGSMFSD